jgi:outer membrane protein TolC
MRKLIPAAKKAALVTIFSAFFALIFYMPQTFSQDQKAEKIPLSLKECIASALANNLDLSIEAFNPDISEASISLSKEQFLPEFGLNYYNQRQTVLGAWGVEGTSFPYKSDSYTLDLTQKVVTGGTATLSFMNSMSDSGRAFQVINPAYNSEFRLRLAQPLLKGFGPKANRYSTLQALNQRDVSVSALKAKLIQTIYDVEQAYWNLYSAIENLKVQESSLEQSREILRRNREAVRIGAKSASEVLNSEVEVARNEDYVLSYRMQVEQVEANLKKILNLPSAAAMSARSIIPSDKPAIEMKQITYEVAIQAALGQRQEIVQAEKQLENNANDISYAKNQLLPQLDLMFNMWSPGQSGIKYLYQDNNPFTGILVGKVEGSRVDALKEALKTTYKNWSVSLALNVPLGNFFSRASLARAKIEQEQNLARLEKQKQSVAYEVAQAIKELQNSERKIKTSAASRELQEKRLAAEMQKYQLGLGTIEWLLSYQNQLTNAKIQEIQALINYKMAVANLERVIGTTLEAKGLKFRDYEF